MRCTLPAVAAAVAALTAAGCGSTAEHKAGPSSSSGTSATAASTVRHVPGRDHAGGLIGSVTGDAISVDGPNGNAQIAFGDSTKITELAGAQRSDVTAGRCVSIYPTLNSGGAAPVVAERVVVSDPQTGSCQPELPPPPGPPGQQQGPPPAAPSPSNPPPGAPPREGPSVVGMVVAFEDKTIVVGDSDPSETTAIQTNVTVTADTRYDKRGPADTKSVVAGKCAEARGTKDDAGVLQATTITLAPAIDGKCGPPARP